MRPATSPPWRRTGLRSCPPSSARRQRPAVGRVRACARARARGGPPRPGSPTRGSGPQALRSPRPSSTGAAARCAGPSPGSALLAALLARGELLAREAPLALHVAPVSLDLLLALAAGHAALRGQQANRIAADSNPVRRRSRGGRRRGRPASRLEDLRHDGPHRAGLVV